ncbi:hypothetical protein LCGC14_0363610 [marine sediment metagenome]|uniref:Uncharacterized protein n=1 Tax=marine sediment metagenome TaxID=412755 RepID=A0A0F9TDB6_9ZZZZ
MKLDTKFAIWEILAGLTMIASFVFAGFQGEWKYKYMGGYTLINLGYSGLGLLALIVIIHGVEGLRKN